MFVPILTGLTSPNANGFAGRFRADALGFAHGSFASPYAFAGAGLVAIAYCLLTFRAVPSVWRMQREVSWFKLVGIYAAVASGIFEEVVFRGMLMDGMGRSGFSPLWQVAASGVIFGLAHGAWHLVSGDRLGTAYAILFTTLVGVALAALYLFSDRNVGPCIAAHVAINVVIEPWLLLHAVDLRHKTSSARSV
jgi:membrane protease YdiL (CAAX protease family)